MVIVGFMEMVVYVEMQNDLNKIKALLRKERIDLLGAFGNRREQRIPDATKYTRKEKHKGK